ncbi:Crp/Fnr family transcriptional regulator [Kribbella catacumbae]|uniref:Crp/Fnr family transcriptional regulator n=1 Tax=Kribbella catacumbae TaxID=460086 RepID=UPI00037B4B6B|nr:Crp/Fnr family transcriptional regulator [Kribbella catacumbae]
MADWPLLASLTPEARRQLLASGRHRRFARREVIFHEGDPGDSLHLVKRGHVAIRITTPLGEVATLTIVGPGEGFGELALLDDAATRSATAVALERTETWTLNRAQFNRLRAEGAAIDQVLIDLLADYVRRLSEHLVEALYLPADKRVARRLLDLAGTYGDEPEIPLTQEDLANLAGTSRATVNRVLGEFERDGVLVVARGRVTVLDALSLAKTAR